MSELVWGIKNGDIDQVKDIVEQKKIDVNAFIDGRVPLHYAADYGQTAVVNYLLDKGADPNKKFCMIKHAVTSEAPFAWFAPVHVTGGGIACLGTWLSCLVGKMVDKHGISVILAAIWEGHTECVKTLLKHGASKNGKTPDGTPYIEAAEKEEIKELLT